MSAVVILGVDVDMLADEEIIVLTAAVIGFKMVIEVACVAEVLAGVLTGAIIGDAPCTGAKINASGLTAVLPAPLEEPFHCS